jgi:NADH-quinone oxidoreductase subunit M
MAVRRVPAFVRRWFNWALGISTGIALLLIVLTAFLMPICIAASWESITDRVQEYMAAFLFMETLMLGVFMAQDLFLFYIFFEAGLIPMYLIIGVWGGKERIYAAYKFFLYTLLGSVLMLIAMLWMVNYSGTTFIPELMVTDFPAQAQTWLWLAFFASFAGQDADVAGPYLAARRPRPGADRGLGHPRRRAAEDGRLRLRSLLAADVPRRPRRS